MIHIYADGACKGNPGKGGWGAYLTNGTDTLELCGGSNSTTNNQMELTAAVEALKVLKKGTDVTLHLDSQYVLKGAKEWLPNWKRKGWKASTGQPVKNKELWQQLDEQLQRHTITYVWVKGHSGNAGNEKADQLANQGIPN